MPTNQLDYRHRPSKSVQRLMVVDVCRRLIGFGKPSEYQYVGFGGLEFVDFDLLHRAVGVHRMTSIEKDATADDRFHYNRPFKTIKIIPGRASDVLADDIAWDVPSIVWLDYTDRLTEEVISDVSLLCGRLISGSILIVTINAHNPPRMDDRRSELERCISDARIPVGVTNEALAKWGLARTQHQVLTDVIRQTMRNRQASAEWRQVLNINYADGAFMQTVAGVIVASQDGDRWSACRFDELPYVRLGGGESGTHNEPLLVRVPFLTAKERRALDEQMPTDDPGQLAVPGLQLRDKVDYSTVYRYAHLLTMPA